MKSLVAGLALLMMAGLAGCAATHPVADYSDLPGSGDNMAKGPGLFAVGQKDDYNGGYTIYSDNPNQKALINPNRSSGTQAKQAPAPAATASESNNYQDFQQFKDYQDFQRFQNMPKDSPEYHKFQEWQQWQRYQQWKAGQQQQ